MSGLFDRLVALGLRDVTRVVTHTNRTVMVSLGARRILRMHQGYGRAPDPVLAAIVRFLDAGASRAARRAARREFLAFPVEEFAPSSGRGPRPERPRPGDLRLLHRLHLLHQDLNRRHFEGRLADIPIRVSSRMRSRLGELAMDARSGRPLEIAISRRHIVRHPWAEVEHTMLHEMVHQWQAETGRPVNHGPGFRRKAREVGVLPAARREVVGVSDGAAISSSQAERGILPG